MCENMSNLCECAGVKVRKRAARGWERVNEGLRFMQSPYYSVNTQSVSLHIREQQRDPPIGCHPTPLSAHTHIQRQWLLLSKTEKHYVLSLTLSTTYSHKTARMNTQLHGDISETVCLNQIRGPNTTCWAAQIYTWYLLSSRSVEFRCWWVVHTDSDFSHWRSAGH